MKIMGFWNKILSLGEEDTSRDIDYGERNPKHFEKEKPFDWTPAIDKAKAYIKANAEVEWLTFKADFARKKEEFSIDISSFRNNTIKIIYNNQIDIIPISDIRRVNLQKGHEPRIESDQYYIVSKDGSFAEEFCEGRRYWMLANSEYQQSFRSDKAKREKDDIVFVSPILKFEVPFGLGESVLDEIQEILAQSH